jgi:hypothetical protein
MPWLRTRVVGPIARPATNRREEVRRALGLGPDLVLVLVTLGGISTALPAERWAEQVGQVVLVVDAPARATPRLVSASTLLAEGFHFSEILGAADALVTKPGYNAFVEAAVASVPVLYAARGDWPEEPFLTAWLRQRVPCLEIPREELLTGAFLGRVPGLLAKPRPPPPAATGAAEAARALIELLPSARAEARITPGRRGSS